MENKTTKPGSLAKDFVVEKHCSQCKQIKPLSEFHKKADGYRSACKVCRCQSDRLYRMRNPERGRARARDYQKKLRQDHPERIKLKRLKDKELGYWKKYQTSQRQDYQTILASQGGKCAICGAEKDRVGNKNLALDHNHVTDETRGILCHSCNTGLGLFQDDPSLLREAANYLEKYREISEVLKIS